MTESEWSRCTDPQAMLDFLRASRKLSERQARLFAVACCRRLWPLLTDERSRKAVEVAERYADGLANQKELRFAFSCAADAYAYASSSHTAAAGAANAARPEAGYYARYVTPRREHPALLRDLFGFIPFRPQPRIDLSWLAWKDGVVMRLAEAVYEEREMPSGRLDNARMAVLADALEEAGCDNQEILGHCRQQDAVHVRGCWLFDLLLNKA
jgi:hypothetical protein